MWSAVNVDQSVVTGLNGQRVPTGLLLEYFGFGIPMLAYIVKNSGAVVSRAPRL